MQWLFLPYLSYRISWTLYAFKYSNMSTTLVCLRMGMAIIIYVVLMMYKLYRKRKYGTNTRHWEYDKESCCENLFLIHMSSSLWLSYEKRTVSILLFLKNFLQRKFQNKNVGTNAIELLIYFLTAHQVRSYFVLRTLYEGKK